MPKPTQPADGAPDVDVTPDEPQAPATVTSAEGIEIVPQAAVAMPPDPKTVAEYREEQRAEWGVYVAAEVIHLGGARAFNIGDPVPVSHVEGGVVTPDQVKKKEG